ncbi:MAG TPA: PAS domain S-box protein [Bryobacteraceae bacterium]|jgi:two-component system, chemotaxis family, CheB/CheR fusion protein|nr:PAS domain S-box protein [Bryobacteraceae bacterium]
MALRGFMAEAESSLDEAASSKQVKMLAMNIRDLMPEADREQALAAFREQCRAGVLEPQRTQRIAKDGRTIEVSLIASELANDAGETYAIATTERIVPV